MASRNETQVQVGSYQTSRINHYIKEVLISFGKNNASANEIEALKKQLHTKRIIPNHPSFTERQTLNQHGGARGKILLIEEYSDVAIAHELMLRNLDFLVDTVSNSKISRIDEIKTYQAILISIKGPSSEALSTLRLIHELVGSVKIKKIILYDRAERKSNSYVRTFGWNISAFVPKPETFSQLSKTLIDIGL